MNNKMQFWETYVDPKVKRQIKMGAIAAYVSSGLTVVAAAALYNNLAFLLDAALLLGLGLGLHLAKNRVCSVILLVYFCISKMIQIVGGQINVAGLLIAAGFITLYARAMMGTFAFQRQWNEYQLQQAIERGQTPGAAGIGAPPPPYGPHGAAQPPYGANAANVPSWPVQQPPAAQGAPQPPYSANPANAPWPAQQPPAAQEPAPQEPASFAEQEQQREQDL